MASACRAWLTGFTGNVTFSVPAGIRNRHARLFLKDLGYGKLLFCMPDQAPIGSP